MDGMQMWLRILSQLSEDWEYLPCSHQTFPLRITQPQPHSSNLHLNLSGEYQSSKELGTDGTREIAQWLRPLAAFRGLEFSCQHPL